VLVAGPSGVGKSAVTRELAPILDADVFASDVVRKDLAGIAPTARATGAACDALYAPSMSARTYAELEARAGRALARRGAAILDATFLRRDQRARVYALARAQDARVVLLWGSASPELVRERIAARASAGADPSDATFDVHRAQLAEMEAPDAATEGVPVVRFDARDDVAAVLVPVAAALWGEPPVA
jgi:predicted kinase